MKELNRILTIDTATNCSSIAITEGGVSDGNALASLSLNTRVTHSRRLLSSIEYLMQQAEYNWSDLNGITVSVGPGSFTGLRIGMATAKGLAMAANLPLLGVSTLDALASRCLTSKLICAVQDARKKEVYTALYRFEKRRVERVSDYRVISPQLLVEQLEESVLFVGDGVKLYGELWQGSQNIPVAFAPTALNTISASTMGFIGCDMLRDDNILDADNAVPLYVRASDAELNLGRKVL